jgi:hypothetical protein
MSNNSNSLIGLYAQPPFKFSYPCDSYLEELDCNKEGTVPERQGGAQAQEPGRGRNRDGDGDGDRDGDGDGDGDRDGDGDGDV